MQQPQQLTEEGVLELAHKTRKEDVVKINVFAMGVDNIDCLSRFPNLQVLSLSLNLVSTLRPLSECTRLQELYLRKNMIADLAQIGYLLNLPLRILWLDQNPCCSYPSYRPLVIKLLPGLEKLDNVDVSASDLQTATRLTGKHLDTLRNRIDSLLRGETPIDTQEVLEPLPDLPAEHRSERHELSAVRHLLHLLNAEELETVKGLIDSHLRRISSCERMTNTEI